ncbi:amino acid permease/ SLC12A domain-containing protein [Paraphoma chrysanthemicola]|uniref:Amino acid permease/ SLC12A domain-containing protein n=1 Tax=Paraphoma chrysanthemicola TaxID=798071 RepID=A0A8K0VWL1_9PLEO|nr:amino acid permease/ SLC12A domain-containing protein [Paraphoma chrysanthemicola]
MITISGVLGVGLYVRGGTILRLGGPLAVLLSFALLGLLAWGVMQCIAEMLCIWPISGALSTYVTEFVDVELGIAVGVAYWFTYAISFAALVAATAGIAEYWETPKGIQGGVLFFLVPAILLVINAFGIQLYGLIEVVGGTLKLSFLAVIVIVMIAINQGAGSGPKLGTSLYPSSVIVRDLVVTDSWAQAFFMSLSIAAFAYVGVEITAASALEARVDEQRNTTQHRAIGRTVKFSAVYISFLAGVMYVLAGVLVTLNIKWDDPRLPRMSWVTGPEEETAGSTASAFVLVAEASLVPGLASTLNVFLIFTALTCANTNLYVASRTLFSLTRSLDGGSGPWYTRILAYFGKTNNRKVPLRALVASCIFAWIPFLYLASSHGPDTSIGTILDVLSEMGSIGVIIVWACECWAYIRFYNCIERNRDALRNVPLVRRWNRGRITLEDDYPYRSHGQPITAYASLFACLFILVIANGAGLWKEFHVQPFLSAYLAPICFLVMWVALKVLRNGQWHLVELSNGEELVRKMLRLHEIRLRSAENSDDAKRGVQNLWGLL